MIRTYSNISKSTNNKGTLNITNLLIKNSTAQTGGGIYNIAV